MPRPHRAAEPGPNLSAQQRVGVCTLSSCSSPPPNCGGGGGGGARAPPRTRPHARALPPRARPSPPQPGGGGAAGGLEGCDAPGAAAALASGRLGTDCWARCSGGARWHSRLTRAARREGEAASSLSAGPGTAGAALPPPPSAPPPGGPASVPIPLALTSRLYRARGGARRPTPPPPPLPLRCGARACTRAAADRRTAAACVRRPRGPAAPSRGADPPRASELSEVLWESRAAPAGGAVLLEDPGDWGLTPRCSEPLRAAGKRPGGAGEGKVASVTGAFVPNASAPGRGAGASGETAK